jgi:hypothetical protein
VRTRHFTIINRRQREVSQGTKQERGLKNQALAITPWAPHPDCSFCRHFGCGVVSASVYIATGFAFDIQIAVHL